MLLLAASASACNHPSPPRALPTPTVVDPQAQDLVAAREALVGFFDDLHEGRYAEAARRYGGPYDVLVDWNPDVDPFDRVTLLAAACAAQIQCMEVGSATRQEQASATDFRFQVEFRTDEGERFELGGCCGATAERTVTQFEISVVRTDAGEFLVMELPPHVP
jgi:hypothetical protein